MITLKELFFKIKDKTLLQNISCVIYPNKITLIVGANGAGKSTLIKLLSQELKATSGKLLFEEKDSLSVDKTILAKQRAVLSQEVDLAFPLNVQEIVMMGRYPHFGNKSTIKDIEICREAMAFFEVEEMAERNYMSLSGGEKQRVHFARVAAQIWPDENKPACRSGREVKYLLLDEPLTYLDIYYQYQFMDKLKILMKLQKMVVIGVVHDLNLAFQYADNILMLSNGHLIAEGETAKVFTTPNIEKAFRMKPHFFKDEKGKQFIGF